MTSKQKLVIIITGGGRGLGRYLTTRFLEEGHIVNVIDIDKGENINNEMINYYYGNVANYDDVSSIFSDIYKRFGRIDVLINNAAKRYFSFLENVTPKDIVDTIAVNLTANYITTLEAFKYMKKTGFGRIVNISSNSSFQEYQKGSLYCATKAGLNVFTQAVSKEIDKNLDITINSLCPGRMYLPQTEEKQNLESGLILPETIFKVVSKTIYSNLNGAVMPIISLRVFLLTFLYQLKKLFKWCKYYIWIYL